ncbi:MAG: hypothetical protein RL514_4552, partial [Verrucomicrobiota bacterium]
MRNVIAHLNNLLQKLAAFVATVSMTRSENSDENEACGAYGARPQAGFARVAEGRLLAKNT